MKQTQDLKRSLFIILVLILVGDFLLVLLNGFFLSQLFIKPTQPEQPEPTFFDVDAAVQATQLAFSLTQTQDAASTLMAMGVTETPQPEETATLEPELTETETATPTLTPSLTVTIQSSLDDGYYTVSLGETVLSIAQKFDILDTAIRIANQMIGDAILNGQRLFIPEDGSAPVWYYAFSDLPKAQQFSTAYTPPNEQFPRFTLNVDPSQNPRNAVAPLYTMQQNSLTFVESFYQETLPGSFNLYVAGTLFTQDHRIRSASYANANMIFIVFDGSGSKTDQQRLITYETARFYNEKTLGSAASDLLKEGAAMYIAHQNAIAIDGSSLPLRRFCATYLSDGDLPDVTAPDLVFTSETVNLINYQTAGCFYEFLYEQSSIDVMKTLYGSGDYEALLGKTQQDLNIEFRDWLGAFPESELLQPLGFSLAVKDLSAQYRNFMPIFNGSPVHLEIYRELDLARINFLANSMTEGQVHLTRAKELINGL